MYIIYSIYILLVISIWTIVSIKINYIGKFDVINGILFYNLKNYSTYLFIILEPIMIVDRE